MLDYRHADFKTFDITIPGTGSISLETPDNVVRKIIYGKHVLTCDATPANRYVAAYVRDTNNNIVWNFKYSSAVVASSGETSYLGPGIVLNVINNSLGDEFIVPEGFDLFFNVANGVAGDTLRIIYLVADYQLTSKDDKSASRRRT